jgi:uncharacterized protein (DUF427 family)
MPEQERQSTTVAVGLSEPVKRTERGTDGDGPKHEVVTEPCPKRIRVYFCGAKIADSYRAQILHETWHLPVYYIPMEDVAFDHLKPTDHRTHCPVKGDARYWSVTVGDRSAENAVWNYPEPVGACPDISDLVAFSWGDMDAWFEEEEEVFVHPRDPYKRIEVVESSRHVQVAVDGVTVADSHRPMMLLETGLPTRYYLPKQDVHMAYLERTDKQTACPYKGVTSQYWSVNTGSATHENLAWCYEYPTPAAAKVAGRICFYDEKVDVYINGERQKRPQTPFS